MSNNKNMDIKTTIELKHLNLRSVYNYVYKVRVASRLDIANNTGLSFPTVAANIQALLDRGLITNCGEQKSTGGRKAQKYKINSLAKVAFGVEILKESIQIAAVDLYGELIKEDTLEKTFENNDEYYRTLGNFINNFCSSSDFVESNSLGVCIAIQGLISPDGESIFYSQILNATGVKRDRFQEYIKQPCILVHDTNAAALAEIWNEDPSISCAYIALNRNFGGTVVQGGLGDQIGIIESPTLEHMCIDPDGPECYCGNRGCIESLCSANAIKKESGMRIPDFFDNLHAGNEKCISIWNNFVKNFAIVINNISMVCSCSFIVGGYMAQYMNEADFDQLFRMAQERIFDKRFELRIKPGRYDDKATKIGAGMILVDSFQKSI